MRTLVPTIALLLLLPPAGVAAAEPQVAPAALTVTLTPDLPSGQPVGTTITWTTTAATSDPTDYRLSVLPSGEPGRIVYDFQPENAVTWTPIEDGSYLVVATARNRVTGETGSATQIFTVTPRAIFGPVVTATDNPLIALYSAPACNSGNFRVVFRRAGGGPVYNTSQKACREDHTNNVYIAGMAQNSTYVMFHQRLVGGSVVETGPPMTFATGSIPASVSLGIPNVEVLDPAGAGTSTETLTLQSALRAGSDTTNRFPFATDLAGNVVWYSDRAILHDAMLLRPSGAGTFFLVLEGPDGTGDQILREVDLAGHVVRQTNVTRVSEQLAAMGMDPVTSFHHEARRLPNGHTVAIGSLERILTDIQGPGPVDVLADYIIVLDQNWQVAWAWHGFDHLDVTRMAVLGETCVSEGPGCPPLFFDDIANDWMHSNAVAYSAADGNFLLSMRHQDWVIKIDYRNGVGDGHVIWRLGPGGDFSIASSDPFPFFSHQHDPNFDANGFLAVYDNANTRCAQIGTCSSRGQVYDLDEVNMTATHVLNADLANYSGALGSAQVLANGNYHFNSGFQNPPLFSSFTDEVRLDGTKEYTLRVNSAVYRSYRLRSLYVGPAQ